MHPDVAIRIAAWLSPQFEAVVYRWAREILQGNLAGSHIRTTMQQHDATNAAAGMPTTTAAFYSTDTLNSRLDQVGRILALMRQVGDMDDRMRIAIQSMLCNTAANLIEGNTDVTYQDPFLNISFRAQELGYRISNSEAQSLGRKVA